MAKPFQNKERDWHTDRCTSLDNIQIVKISNRNQAIMTTHASHHRCTYLQKNVTQSHAEKHESILIFYVYGFIWIRKLHLDSVHKNDPLHLTLFLTLNFSLYPGYLFFYLFQPSESDTNEVTYTATVVSEKPLKMVCKLQSMNVDS